MLSSSSPHNTFCSTKKILDTEPWNLWCCSPAKTPSSSIMFWRPAARYEYTMEQRPIDFEIRDPAVNVLLSRKRGCKRRMLCCQKGRPEAPMASASRPTFTLKSMMCGALVRTTRDIKEVLHYPSSSSSSLHLP
jgi:hypothetical protein